MRNSLTSVARRYSRKTPGSATLYRRSRQLFPSGVTHDARYMLPHPIYIERAHGSRKWDVDGHEYIDYFGGHGALILGHNHPIITEAVSQQLSRGTHYGASHNLEVEWAELITELIPSAEKVRFTNSGTEASLLAMRIARAFTGKNKIVRFHSHFHGWHDQIAYAVHSHFDGSLPAGVPASMDENILLCPPNNEEKFCLDGPRMRRRTAHRPAGKCQQHTWPWRKLACSKLVRRETQLRPVASGRDSQAGRRR